MRGILKKAAAATAGLVLVATAAGAGVVGSKHDMTSVTGISWDTEQGSAGACSFCHIPHKATGAKAWSGVPGGTSGTIGTIGTLCYNCHGSTGVFSTDANVSATIAFDMSATGAHGLSSTPLATWGDSMASAVGLPYTASTSLEANMIQCSSCHDAHNDAADPFLQGSYTVNDICAQCHQNREAAAAQLFSQTTHPANNAVAFQDEATAPDHPTTVPATLGPYRDTGQTPTAGTEQPWLAGVHTSDGTATGDLVCVSCHSVHGVQPATQGAPTQGLASETGANRKVLIFTDNTATASTFCEACHTTNPGGTADTTHPVNQTVATVGDVYSEPPSPFIDLSAQTTKATCRHCHGVHPNNAVAPAVANSPLLVDSMAYAPGTDEAFCSNCHSTANTFLAEHHPANTAWAGMEGNATTTGLQSVTWGDTDGVLCYNCHRAHNAPDSVSILRIAKADGAIGGTGTLTASTGLHWDAQCVGCHSELPGVYSANDAGDTSGASHYVGDISVSAPDLSAYAYAGTWSSSAVSYYGGTAAAPVMICQSCHTMMADGVVGNHLLVGDYGNDFVPASGDVGLCRECHVPEQDTAAAAAGTWYTGWNTGATSIIAKTHPLESLQDGTAVDNSKYAVDAGSGLTYPSGQTIANCESCHVAHNAFEGLGAYILERSTDSTAPYSGNWSAAGFAPTARSDWFPTTKDETGFCGGCHNQE